MAHPRLRKHHAKEASQKLARALPQDGLKQILNACRSCDAADLTCPIALVGKAAEMLDTQSSGDIFKLSTPSARISTRRKARIVDKCTYVSASLRAPRVLDGPTTEPMLEVMAHHVAKLRGAPVPRNALANRESSMYFFT